MGHQVSIIGVLLCSVVFGAMAGPPPHDSTVAAGDSVHQKFWAQLNLTVDQKQKLKAIREENKDFRKANFEKMRALLEKSKDELLKPSPSKSVLYGYAKEMGDLHKTEAEHMADHMLKLKTILTKEQFEKLIKMGPPHGMHGMKDHPHRGGPGTPPPPDMDD
jgi:Spy/CpxP family protein refolding chaperone